MLQANPTKAVGSAVWRGAVVLLLLIGVVGWQGWLTLGLFGPDDPWSRLISDEPIVSGFHPQHYYLGSIGARSMRESGHFSAYVPDFQAGFPKTPIFNGSRLGEVFLFLGGSYRPASYKIGIAAVCLLVPFLLFVACRGAGLNFPATLGAVAVGLLLWWGPAGRASLEAGETELTLASLALLAHIGMLVRYDRAPGFWPWFGMLLTACLGWFLQPTLFPIALPLLLIYYLSAGARHGSLTWHTGLLLAEVGGLTVNLPWLIDWVGYWWLRSELPVNSAMLPHRTLGTLWNAPLWGGDLERGLVLFLLGSAAVGSTIWNQTHQRPAARLFGLGAGLLFVLALLGVSWEPLGRVGTGALLLPALLFAALPAAHAWVWFGTTLLRFGGTGRAVLVGLLAGVVFSACWFHDVTSFFISRGLTVDPLEIGLGSKRQAIVDKIVEHTGTEARILWEDRKLASGKPRWSPLLPGLTGRTFMGGLDPDATIEHSSISFVDQALEGQHISTWSDQQLDEYCRRYNIGWTICWSSVTIKRFLDWEGAIPVLQLEDDVPGQLFLIKHAPRTFITKGHARLVHADAHHITLADVVPDNGVVVLNLHYQTGLYASPGRVLVEREQCGHDPIGFIRLVISGPVARVTLTWGDR